MRSYISTIKNWVLVHKKISIVVALVIIGGGYWTISSGNDNVETRYVLAQVERDTIISSISGTGQVSAANEVTLTAKASGDLVYLNAKVGQEVSKGTLIAQVEATDAKYDLESAEIDYQEYVTIDEGDLQDALDTLENERRNARNVMSSAISDMESVAQSLKDLYTGGFIGVNAEDSFRSASAEYSSYRYSKTWEQLSGDVPDLIDDLQNVFRSVPAGATDNQLVSALLEFRQVASTISSLAEEAEEVTLYLKEEGNDGGDEAYADVQQIVDDAYGIAESISSAQGSLADAVETYEELRDGPDALDIRGEALSVEQKRQTYYDHFVIAPFDGVIASVSAEVGDSVNSGTNIATLITKQKIAEISLNEIDAAKVKVGQKATLLFDAVENLSITGEVLEVDLVGTVSQGVVSYNVKIGFDTDDDRVKSGMTVSANIITDMRQDVLTVPISAIIYQGDLTFVNIVNNQTTIQASISQDVSGILLDTPPQAVPVEVGLSDDESIEILSGLEEGEQYVERTITTVGSTGNTGSQAPSLFGGNTGGVRTGGTGGNFQR